MAKEITFPYEIVDLDADTFAETRKYFVSSHSGYVLVGPHKYFLSYGYKQEGAKIYNMEVRPTDTFVASFPKSGTTWTQELVWLLGNDHDYDTAMAKTLDERFPFLDLPLFFGDEGVFNFARNQFEHDEKGLQMLEVLKVPIREILDKMPASSPRYVKTHLPLSLLPPKLLDTAKVVYVARDPRDVAVSFYHHSKLYKIMGFNGDFKTYWHFFYNDMVDWAPYFSHVKEAWAKRNDPNMLFLFYEELTKDLPACVRRVASFLGKFVTDDQVARLCDHLSFKNFKNNPSVNAENLRQFGVLTEGETFVRKGKAGGWRAYFDEEMAAQAQRWIDDNLRGTDLRFPSAQKHT